MVRPVDPVIQALIDRRNERKLTQRQLAKLCRISQSHIAHIESGRVRGPRLDTIRILADALDMGLKAYPITPVEE